jgi:hypothetical protein
LRASTDATQARSAPSHGESSPPLPTGSKAAIRLTLGELVEAVSAVIVDVTEQAAVVNHILDTQGGNRRSLPGGSGE